MQTRTYNDGNGHLVIENVNDKGQVVTRTVLPENTPVEIGSDDVTDENNGGQR
ncbi:hypothetical protein [Saccharopolyspora endophytica]|uniref:Uncharacterized protein n=1 Tax=Saccharopolyspora endophytica TaxID=543886 RepID=A0ABS5DEB2_9PSEU|nr:hypothetical protein [Saccharopolyspora endophytica]MBQ0924611.1 hypothetical protein [Saccharopolyspora endophytica]